MQTNEIDTGRGGIFAKARLLRAGVAAFIGCAACCAVPFIASAALGSTGAATITHWMRPGVEFVVGLAVFLGVLSFMAFRARNERVAGCGAACDADGACCDRGSRSAR